MAYIDLLIPVFKILLCIICELKIISSRSFFFFFLVFLFRPVCTVYTTAIHVERGEGKKRKKYSHINACFQRHRQWFLINTCINNQRRYAFESVTCHPPSQIDEIVIKNERVENYFQSNYQLDNNHHPMDLLIRTLIVRNFNLSIWTN